MRERSRRARRRPRCWAPPRFAEAYRSKVAEVARALNQLNVGYLLDAFGRVPRVSPATAAAVLEQVWTAVIADP